jgi:CubicO group peptidase (beta-lactamase class C family)
VGLADLERRRPAGTADQFPWFSMTKIATATAAVRLAGEGQLNLDAPITEYLTDYPPGRYPSPTALQLLTHTAGLRNPLPVRWVRPEGQPPNANLVEALVNKYGRPHRPPGTRASYSNIGYLLLGQVLESVTGQSTEQAITDLVLRPLGMTDTGFGFDAARPRATGYLHAPWIVHPLLRRFLPEGVVAGRVDGYSALRGFLVEGAAYGGLIGPADDAGTLGLAHLVGPTDHAPLGDLSGMQVIRFPGKPFDHGIGWFRRPRDGARAPAFVEHYGTGGGFWNAMRLYPTAGVAVVGMTNGTHAWPYDDFFSAVVSLLGEHGHLSTQVR